MITVIIPVFNSESYLEECILSVVNQDFKEIELIVVDDCSTDNSYKIAERLAANDDRIILLRQKRNLGVAAARNRGLSVAKGDLVLFLDSDDYLFDNCLKKIDTLQKRTGADVIISLPVGNNNVLNEKLEFFSRKKAIKYFLNCRKISGYSWGKIYKRSIISKIRFHDDMSYGEDGVFSFDSICNSNIIIYTNYKFYKYRIRNNSLTGRNTDFSDKNLDIFKQIKYLKKVNVDFPIKWLRIFEFVLCLSEIKNYENSSKNAKRKYSKTFELMHNYCSENWLNVAIHTINLRVKKDAILFGIHKIGNRYENKNL